LALIAAGERGGITNAPPDRPCLKPVPALQDDRRDSSAQFRAGGFAPFFAQSLIDLTGVKRKSR
jgi:hypothetical protein